MKYALALILLLLSSATARAGHPWDGAPFSGDPAAIATAAAALPAPADADAVVLSSDMRYRIDADHRVTKRFHLVFRVINARGAADWKSVGAFWDPWRQKRPVIRARVISPTGAVTNLDPASLTATPPAKAPHDESDRRKLYGSLPAMTAGVVVEQLFEFVDDAPLLAGGTLVRHYFASTVPTLRERVVIDAAPGVKVSHVGRLLAGKPTVRKQRGRTLITYRANDLPPYQEAESALPARLARYPYVELATGRSWNQIARAYQQLFEKAIASGLPPDVVVKRGTSIETLLTMVNDRVRTTDLAIGSAPIEPWTPAETWWRKYGDSRDRAVLLVAMLRAAGERAQIALVRSGPGQELESALPGPQAFDQALVYLPKKKLWIDPGEPLARAGQLSAGTEGRLALVADRGSRRLVRTPASTARDNRYEEVREIHMSDRGKARVVERTRLHGRAELRYRRDHRDTRAADMKERLEKYARDEYGGTLRAYRTTPPTRLGQPFELTLEIDDTTFESYLDDAEIRLRAGPAFAVVPPILTKESGADDATRRRGPLAITLPHTYQVRYRIILPAGWRAPRLPRGKREKLGPIELTSTVAQTAGEIDATFVLTVPVRELSADDVRSVRKKVQAFLQSTAALLELEHGPTADIEAGKVATGLAAQRALAASQPTSAIQRVRLAYAALTLGLRDAAAAEARRAIAIHASTDAYAALGWVLSHDELGREHQPGWDRAGAIAAYRKAVALDPDNSWTRLNLAVALEHSAAGVRYDGELDLAIAEYEELRKRGDDSYDDNLLHALLRAGQFAKLRTTVQAMPAGKNRDPLLIAAIAAIDGPKAAMAAVDAARRSPAERTTLRATAADLLSYARNYSVAAALLGEATGGGVITDATTRALASSLKRTRRHETLKPGAKDPLRVAHQVLFAAVGLRASLASLDRIRSPRVTPLGADPLERLVFAAMRKASAAVDMPFNTRVDRMIEAIRFKTTKQPWGAMVEGTVNSSTLRTYAVRARGGYRLVSAFGWPVPMAAEALARADRRDAAGAEGWLSWASDEVGRGNTVGLRRSGQLFKTLWTGRRAGNLDDLRRAAAALLTVAAPKRALAELDDCRVHDPTLAADCFRVMFDAALIDHDAAGAKRALEGLAKAAPSTDLTLERLSATASAGRWDAVEADARALLAKNSKSTVAHHFLSVAICMRDSPQACNNALAAEVALFDNPTDKNNFAWQSLLLGSPPSDKALAAIEEAVATRGQADAASLNTLAAVQAARGELGSARASLLRTLENTAGTMREADWLVHGMIAAGAGYADSARAAFKRVSKPRQPGQFDTYDIMLRWRNKLPAP